MNIRPTLKITLFTLVSAIISMAAYMLTNIIVIALIAEAFLFCAYFSFVLWLCCIIHKKCRLSSNFISIIIPFSIALYSGVRKYAFTNAEDINIIKTWTLNDLFFVVASLITLICVLVLVGRIIFGNPFKPAEEIPQEPQLNFEENTQVYENYWVCECGERNTGKFCAECGKPMATTADEQAKPTENADQ